MNFPDLTANVRVPHRKKLPEDKLNQNWTAEEVCHLVFLRNTTNLTLREICDNTNVSLTTLWKKIRQLANGDPAKPKQGPKTKFTPMEEQMMVMYLDECWSFFIPRPKEIFKLELVNYMECYGITNTFPNIIPGKGWSDRFHLENPGVKFPTPDDVVKYENTKISIPEWNAVTDDYILNQELEKLPSGRHCVFIMECQRLEPISGSRIAFDVVIVYNAEGVIFQPLIVHDGRILQEIQDNYSQDMDFICSQDGHMSFNSLGRSVQFVHRYMTGLNLPFPAVLYLSPSIAKHMSFATWRFAKESCIVVIPVPKCIFGSLTSMNLGIFVKLEPIFRKVAMSRIYKHKFPMNCGNYAECLLRSVKSLRTSAHLRKGFARLQVLALDKQRADHLVEEEEPILGPPIYDAHEIFNNVRM